MRFAVEGLPTSGPLPDEAGQHLEQILREALSNTARHAGACSVRVSLVLRAATSSTWSSPTTAAGRRAPPTAARRPAATRACATCASARAASAAASTWRRRPAGGTRVVLAVPLDSDEPEIIPADPEREVTFP